MSMIPSNNYNYLNMNFLEVNNFILIRGDCYFINLNLFFGAEDFNISY